MMKRVIVAAFAAAIFVAGAAQAADTLKVTISHKSSWDAVPCLVAQDKGFFKEQNLDITFINAAGGSETVQTVATGSVQIVANASVHAAVAAYAKGAAILEVLGQFKLPMLEVEGHLKLPILEEVVGYLKRRSAEPFQPLGMN